MRKNKDIYNTNIYIILTATVRLQFYVSMWEKFFG